MDIVWKTPPPDTRGHNRRGTGKAATFADALRQDPGKWAYYGRHRTSTATYLRKRYGLEAVSRNWDAATDKSDIYARYPEEVKP